MMNLDPQILYFLVCFSFALLTLGFMLSCLNKKSIKKGDDSLNIVYKLNAVLPGVQCAQCGHPGCEAYAKAVASGDVPCNRCVPGGPDTTAALAAILGIEPPNDSESDEYLFNPRNIALIHESVCTGCTRCTRVCPVDAITGIIKNPHAVDPEECTGCGECLKVCPERCIEMVKLPLTTAAFNWEIASMRVREKNL